MKQIRKLKIIIIIYLIHIILTIAEQKHSQRDFLFNNAEFEGVQTK